MNFLENFHYITLIPAVTIVILLIAVFAAIFIEPQKFKETRTSVFLSIMGSVAVLVLAFNVFLTSINIQMQQTINSARYTKETIDTLWLHPNAMLAAQTDVRPEFRSSLYYNNLTLYNLTKDINTKPTVESTLQEQNLSILFIQCWEDFLTFRAIDKTGDEVWLVNFLQWAQSPYLKKYFETLKYNYAPTTIKFGELLFEYAAQFPVPTVNPELYKEAVDKLLKDKRLVGVFEERKKKG